MDWSWVIFVVILLLSAVIAQALVLRSIRNKENVDIPFTITKGIGKHWDAYLDKDVKRKYQFQYAGWVILFIVIGSGLAVLAEMAIGV